ncbi:MAG: DUF4190 domain-containing protein [Actinomycetes bacterium]
MSINDPFSSQPGEQGMRPAEPSAPAGFTPQEPTPQQSTPWGTPPEGGYAPAGQAPIPPAPAAPPAPGYQQAYYPAARPPKSWMNITSFVTSLLGLSLVAIIFGHLGVNAAKRGEADYKGLGIAGLVIGYVTLASTVIALAIVFGFAITGEVTTS